MPFISGMCIIFAFGAKVLWKLPVERYILWDWIILCFGFWYTSNDNLALGLGLAIMVGVSNFFSIFGELFTQGTIKERLSHKMRLNHELLSALNIVLAYSIIYLSLAKLDPNNFNPAILSVSDSIYFSARTASLGAYSQISPNSDLTKIVTTTEVIFGFLFLVVFLSTFIPVWQRVQKNEQKSS